MYIVALVSKKGGTGQTILRVNLAVAVAQIKKTTLLTSAPLLSEITDFQCEYNNPRLTTLIFLCHSQSNIESSVRSQRLNF